ncbi:uncharacterized protein LOC62_04G005891 [Vanrija pseudolonga]|uniref:Uncharacterized protein n=1 Tax=Vanrija pseudolonga TaxID=143232 RepID=A0AAF0Y9J1_9TREE|nr:hypothetical protein LOC62_04G005891 [Vanrija pseudolonga]
MASTSATDINNSYNSIGGDSLDHPKAPNLTHRSSSTPGTPGGAGGNEHHHRAEQGKYGNTDNLIFHDDYYGYQHITRIREIFRPPVVRQWIENGKLYREPGSREISRFELFFDLLFVAIIHQLADAAAVAATGLAVARFILTFYPSWSIWQEATRYSNVSGTDDMLHRLWVLIGMGCLLGYSANATAIEIHPTKSEMAFDHSAMQAAVAFWLVIKLTRVVVLWWYAYRLPDFRTFHIFHGIGVLIPMLFYLPLIWVTNRPAQIALATIAICVDLIRLDSVALIAWGRLNQTRKFRRDQVAGLNPERGRGLTLGRIDLPNMKFPAINIEHSIERSGAFVVIVLGELVMNMLYVATPASSGESSGGHTNTTTSEGATGEGGHVARQVVSTLFNLAAEAASGSPTTNASTVGLSPKYGKAVLGLMVAWALNFLYTIPSEELNQYTHALRRSWLTGLLFSFLHWPLCAALVLASAAASKFVLHDEELNSEESVTLLPGLRWYWGCGLGFALIITASLDLLHGSMHHWRATRIPRGVRFAFAVMGGLILILVPLAGDRLNILSTMGVSVGVVWAVVAVQAIGILPSKWALAHPDLAARGQTETDTRPRDEHGQVIVTQATAANILAE